MHTPGVSERAPEPYVALSPEGAETAGFVAGQSVTVTLPGERGTKPGGGLKLPLRLVDGLPAGVAGLPLGLEGLPYVHLPTFAGLAASASEEPEGDDRA